MIVDGQKFTEREILSGYGADMQTRAWQLLSCLLTGSFQDFHRREADICKKDGAPQVDFQRSDS